MILEVTSSDFRKDTKSYFDAASEGKKVLIKRGRKTYALVPVTEDDMYFTPAMIEKINESKEQILNGKSKRVKNIDELRKVLDEHDKKNV